MNKPIFQRNEQDYTMTAFLNWRFFKNDSVNSFLTLGEGYIQAGLELIENLIKNNDNKRADIYIFPILHNLNHSIELYLKGLIWTLNILINNNKGREGQHNIHQLYYLLRARIKTFEDGTHLKYFEKEFAPLKLYIDELYSQTDGNDKNDQMDFSRYPVKTSNEEHFYVVVGKNIEIDLLNLYHQFEKIYQILDQATDFFYWIKLKEDQ